MVAGVCRHLLSSVTLHSGPAGSFTCSGQLMTSCRLQFNYSSTVTQHGGPVLLRNIRVTPCYIRAVVIVVTIVITRDMFGYELYGCSSAREFVVISSLSEGEGLEPSNNMCLCVVSK